MQIASNQSGSIVAETDPESGRITAVTLEPSAGHHARMSVEFRDVVFFDSGFVSESTR